MDILVVTVAAILLFGTGYAVRGFVGRELKKAAADFKADRAALVADIKAEIAKLKTDAVSVAKKL